MEWNEMWDGMERDVGCNRVRYGMEWSEMEWSEVWSGMEWSGMGWNGMEWDGMEQAKARRALIGIYSSSASSASSYPLKPST